MNREKPRDFAGVRNKGFRHQLTVSRRSLAKPADPKGVQRKGDPQRMIFPRPANSRRERDFRRYQAFKQKLMKRYDTDEYNRRRGLTVSQHGSDYGRVGAIGYRDRTTGRSGPGGPSPYNRDRVPHMRHENSVRQYAAQLESFHAQKYHHAAEMDVFRWKRTVFTFRKKQQFYSKITGKG